MRKRVFSNAAIAEQSPEIRRRRSILATGRARLLQVPAIGAKRTLRALAMTGTLLAAIGAGSQAQAVNCGPGYGTACFPLKVYLNGGAAVTGAMDLSAATLTGNALVSGNFHFTGTPVFDALSIATLQNTPIGSITPSTGSFTDVTASGTLTVNGTVSGGAFSTWLTLQLLSPGAIGTLTPAGAKFTTLSASSTVSGAGFSTYLASPPAIGSTAAGTGKFTTLQATGLITPSSTSGIKGTATNDNATAGSVGEVISTSINYSIGVAMTTGTNANTLSLSLTAGDWDCSAVATFVGISGPPTISAATAGLSTTTATLPLPTVPMGLSQIAGISSAGGSLYLPISATRFSLSGSATLFLVSNVVFSGGTLNTGGYAQCRRAR